MSEALISILCDELAWCHVISSSVNISFSHDGTGELWACGEMPTHIIACDISWKCLSSNQPVPRAKPAVSIWTSLWTAQPEYLGTLQLEITLHNRLAESILKQPPPHPRDFHDFVFNDLAWQTKTVKIDFERGHFNRAHVHTSGSDWRSSLRLTFDQSPYPPVEAYGFYEEHSGPYGHTKVWAPWLLETNTFTNEDRPMQDWPLPPRPKPPAPKTIGDPTLPSPYKSIWFPGALLSDYGKQESLANNKAMSTILCEQAEWTSRVGQAIYLDFSHNKTGERTMILAFKWAALELPPNMVSSLQWAKKHQPHVIGGLHLQMTLQKRLLNNASDGASLSLESRLTEEAWQPRTFIVMVEKTTTKQPLKEKKPSLEYRLVFGQSPFPSKAAIKVDSGEQSQHMAMEDLAEKLAKLTHFKSEVSDVDT